MSSTIVQQLRTKVRYAKEPDNPLLISLWITQENTAITTLLDKTQLRNHYEAQFRLLLDTIADELLPTHWRRNCLDHIFIPITSLQKLADNDSSQRHIRQLMAELNINCQYVTNSL